MAYNVDPNVMLARRAGYPALYRTTHKQSIVNSRIREDVRFNIDGMGLPSAFETLDRLVGLTRTCHPAPEANG